MATTTTITFSSSTQEMVAPPATAPINIQSAHFAPANPSLGESPGDSGYESSWPSLSEAAAWSPPPGQKRLANLKSDQDQLHFDGLGSSPFDKNTALLLSQPLVPHARYCSENKKRSDKGQLQHTQGLTQTQMVQGQQQQQQQSTRQGKGQRRRARTQAYQAKRMTQLQAIPLVDLTSPIMEEDDPHNPDLGPMEPPIPLSVIPRGWLYEDVSSSLADDILIALPKREWIYESTGPMSMDAKSFVVMSWNLLSPRLCHPLRLDADCEPVFLEWAYRREAILNQIAFTDADIVCLQELELRDYEEYFCPHMTRLGFRSIHAYKMNVYEMRDGCAIFYRDSRFKLINEHVLRFNQVELDDYNVKRPSMARDTAIRFNLFHNLAIVALFENKRTKRQVQVATTHLLADPAFPDAKMLQTAILTSKLEELKAEAMAKLSSGSTSSNGHHRTTATLQATSGNNNNSSQSVQHIPTILAGDFNSLPDSSVVRFLKSGQVDTCHFGGNDFGRFTRAHSKYFYHRLGLADSYKSSILPFTNATRHFQGTIDYLLYDPSSLGLVGFMDHFEVDPVWAAANSTKSSGLEGSSMGSTSTANMSSSDLDSELEQDLVSSPSSSSSSLDAMSSPLSLTRGKRAAKRALKKMSHQGLDFSKLFPSETSSTGTSALVTTPTKKDDSIPIRATLPTALPSQHFPSDHIPLVALFREREYTPAPSSQTSSQ
ncbi:Glucose-repressible alcohol dehydrogenase transcriptional effector [Mortierella hygrophila]|uniref:Glucose-repressible alcohol dehydrogenase transcriptional effector n=1 Tax=Mortierella hygrophila TaxID=979708 RepID=A0A9P6EZ53_9FUNG|nr:Glucose-repressible alcohol dehydrogenase transcriptional effector [Mortierella hygrophila]